MSVRLHCVYRSYGGENTKGRPPYYSKLRALSSYLRAVEEADQPIDTLFVNDGPMPEDRLSLMNGAGKVVPRERLGMRGSYRAALSLALDQGWDEGDLVWLSEDDYLYQADAFSQLLRAAEVIPNGDYFPLYASTASRPCDGRADYEASVPPGWHEFPPIDVDGHRWVNVFSTTSTFGVRLGVLREDLGIHLQCMIGLRHLIRDHETCLVYEGIRPYRWGQVLKELALSGDGELSHRAKLAMLTPVKIGLNLRSHRRTARRRLMFAPDPNLATHMTLPVVAPDVDWEGLAEQTSHWAAMRPTTETYGDGT